MSFFDEGDGEPRRKQRSTPSIKCLRVLIETTNGDRLARETIEELDMRMAERDIWLRYTPLGQPDGARATVRKDTITGLMEVGSAL